MCKVSHFCPWGALIPDCCETVTRGGEHCSLKVWLVCEQEKNSKWEDCGEQVNYWCLSFPKQPLECCLWNLFLQTSQNKGQGNCEDMYGQLTCILKSGQIILLVLKGQISCFWFHYWEYAQPEKGKCLFGPQLPYNCKQLALCMCFLSSLKHQERKHEFYQANSMSLHLHCQNNSDFCFLDGPNRLEHDLQLQAYIYSLAVSTNDSSLVR